MNFIEILIAFLAGWLSAVLAVMEGYAIVKPYLDRKLLPPPTTKPAKTEAS